MVIGNYTISQVIVHTIFLFLFFHRLAPRSPTHSVTLRGTKRDELFANRHSAPELLLLRLARRGLRLGCAAPLGRAVAPLDRVAAEEEADVEPVDVRGALVRLREAREDALELRDERVDGAVLLVRDRRRRRRARAADVGVDRDARVGGVLDFVDCAWLGRREAALDAWSVRAYVSICISREAADWLKGMVDLCVFRRRTQNGRSLALLPVEFLSHTNYHSYASSYRV